jgi:hypothetical protein
MKIYDRDNEMRMGSTYIDWAAFSITAGLEIHEHQWDDRVEERRALQSWSNNLLQAFFMVRPTAESAVCLNVMFNKLPERFRRAAYAVMGEWLNRRTNEKIGSQWVTWYGDEEDAGGFTFEPIGHARHWLMTGNPECSSIALLPEDL